MISKAVLVSSFIISATCMVLHQSSLPPVWLRVPQDQDVNYNFAYEVNDYKTGDIKSQSETRIGDTVLGQYSLVQPDGITRNVEYRADDRDGFRATVTNDGKPVNQNNNKQQNNARDELKKAEEQQRQTTESNQPDITSTQGIEPEQILSRVPNLDEILAKFLTVQNFIPPSRSYIFQSVPNSQEPLISSVLHA